MKKILPAFTVLIFAALACQIALPGSLVGSGNIVTRPFEVSDFDQIRLSTSGNLYIEQDEQFSLTVEADDNILPALNVDVTMGVLRLTADPKYTAIKDTRLVYRVTLPDLAALDLSSSGDIFVGDMQTPSLTITVSGSGDVVFSETEIDALEINVNGSGDVTFESISAKDITASIYGSGDISLRGVADTISIPLSGSGKVFAEELRTRAADVSISGSGDANLWVTDVLTVLISGSGDVNFWDTPRVDLRSKSGSGELNPLGEK